MPAKFRDLKRFCERDRWVLIRSTDHWYYEKVLPDGRVLRTKVSRSLQREIPRHLWERILKHQLHITEVEFWKKLR